jgi:hypothetical protein
MKHCILLLVCLLFLLHLPQSVQAETFHWTDRDGTTHFTDDISNVPLPFRQNNGMTGQEPVDPFQDGGLSGIRVHGISILEQGVYEARPIGEYPANTISSDVKVAADVRLLKSTAVVPAVLGTVFGITYVVDGTPSDGSVDITVKVVSPPLHDPASSEPPTEQSWLASKKLNEKTYDFYVFEKEWELVHGTWTIQILYRGKLLGFRSFEVRAAL